jgi:alpha-tubulin suppressor-like RCC1 family protein
MKVLRRSRRLARAGGCAALALGMAGAAGAASAPAQARVTAILITSNVAAGWGYNAQGQLGDGTIASRSGFGDIRVGNDVVQAAAGSGHGLALRSDGTVWAWGDDSAGQLGSARSSTPVTRPVNTIGAGSGITQLSAGDFHVLALKSNGSVLAWGSNGSGQLGNGTTTDPAGAVQVTGLTNATQVAAGERFSLAVHTMLGLLGS